MANLGSNTTPISGESFDLPSGWSIKENASGEVIIQDTGGTVIARRDETNSEWVFDSFVADAIESVNKIENPTYATLADVPTTLDEGTQVYVESENAVYVEDGT
jgi:hypothetical protein